MSISWREYNARRDALNHAIEFYSQSEETDDLSAKDMAGSEYNPDYFARKSIKSISCTPEQLIITAESFLEFMRGDELMEDDPNLNPMGIIGPQGGFTTDDLRNAIDELTEDRANSIRIKKNSFEEMLDGLRHIVPHVSDDGFFKAKSELMLIVHELERLSEEC